MRNISVDLDIGVKGENNVKSILDDVFGTLINNNESNQFDNFDFKNNNFYVEHKHRIDLQLEEVKTKYIIGSLNQILMTMKNLK